MPSKRRRADFVIRTDLDHRRAKVQIAAVIDAAGTARPAWPQRWPLMAWMTVCTVDPFRVRELTHKFDLSY